MIPRRVNPMTTNLHGIYTMVDPQPTESETKQAWPRYKFLNATISRFNVSILGIQEHYIPYEHQTLRVTEKIQGLLPNRWGVIVDPSCTARSGVAITWRSDKWSRVSAFSVWEFQFRVLGAGL